MQTSNEQGAIVHQATVEIAPIYQKAIAQTASHYKVMIAFVRSCHRKTLRVVGRIPALQRPEAPSKHRCNHDIDYGVIPGTSKPNGHPTSRLSGSTVLNAIQHPCPPLLKPGAPEAMQVIQSALFLRTNPIGG